MPLTMQTRIIPKSGEPIPLIGLGTWRTFDVGSSERSRAPLVEVLDAFSEAGGRVIDTSPMYGRAEEVVGALKRHLSQPFLATKVWTRGRQSGMQQMERSFGLLHARQIDLIQIHNLVDWRTHLETLRRWKSEGRIRYIGITHYERSAFPQLEEIMRGEELDFVQLPLSVGLPDAARRLLPLAEEKGIAVVINRPFEGGSLMRRLQRKKLPAWAAEFNAMSWSELMLRWIASHRAVTCVIPATGSVDHLRQNVRAGEGPVLSERQRDRLGELLLSV